MQNGVHVVKKLIYTKLISEIFNEICFTLPTLRVTFIPLTIDKKKRYGPNIFFENYIYLNSEK